MTETSMQIIRFEPEKMCIFTSIQQHLEEEKIGDATV